MRPAIWMLAGALLLLGACAGAPKSADPEGLALLAKTISVEPERIRMLAAGEWWQQTGFGLPDKSDRVWRARWARMSGSAASVVALTDDAIHILRRATLFEGYEMLARIPYSEVANATTADNGSLLVLRRRGTSQSAEDARARDFIRFFNFPPLAGRSPDPKDDAPFTAGRAAALVNSALLPPTSNWIPDTLPVKNRTHAVAVVTPRWRPVVTVAPSGSATSIRDRAAAGAEFGAPFVAVGSGLAMLGGGLAAVSFAAAGVVVGAAGAAVGAAMGVAEVAFGEEASAKRRQHAAISGSGVTQASDGVLGHEALRSCLLRTAAALPPEDIATVPQKTPLLLAVDGLGPEAGDDRLPYLPLFDERIGRYLELRLAGIEFFSDAASADAAQADGLPVRMRVSAEFILSATFGVDAEPHWRKTHGSVIEITDAHLIRDWAANDAALVRSELRDACQRIGRKIGEEAVPGARVLETASEKHAY